MKKLLFLLLAAGMMACGGNETKEETTAEEGTAAVNLNDEGLQLIANSDCVACHKVDEKVIGPAYKEVAERYHGSDTAVAYLAKKIIEGGAGNWGTVPMTAHPQHSQEEAEKMARYILTLHNQ